MSNQRIHGETVSMNEIENRHSGAFFNSDTLRFWKSRLPYCGYWYAPDNVILFITTDHFGTIRKASIRSMTLDGTINTVKQFVKLETAKRYVAKLIKDGAQ